MAAVTLTNTTANFDETPVLGLLNGETITLNNSTLNIDSDVRWGQNAAVLGAMTISATLGGNINVDGTKTWWIPFDAPSGNVPTLGTWNVQNCTGGTSGATGEFLGIFTALGVAPSASGGAIPSTGFIKFRSKVGDFVDNEVITLPGGSTITVNSATGGQRGWIHLAALEATTVTVPRLGRFQTRGDWFELGLTNGADDQTFQFPVLDACPAIQIETAAGSGVFEWYLNGGSRWGTATAFISQDARGKYFGMDNTTGVITIARRASNACGFKPVTGCRVRIPNIILSSSTAANYALNTINATLATRYDFTTTGSGDIDIEHVSCNWYLSLTNPFQVKISNSSILHAILVSNTAGSTEITNSAIGLNSTNEYSPISLTNLFSGGTFNGLRAARYASSGTGQLVLLMTDCVDFTINNSQFEIFGSTTAVTRGNGTVYTALLTRVNNTVFNNCNFIGSRIDLVTSSDVTLNNSTYADALIGSTTTTNPQSFIIIGSGSNRLTVNGFANFAGIANINPKQFVVSAGNTFGITILNIGTPVAPYNGGAATFQLRAVLNATVCTDILVRRTYFINLENNTGYVFLTNTCQRVEVTNYWMDDLDSTPSAGLAMLSKGVKGAASGAAQTAVYGTHLVEGFSSTTAGFLNFIANEPLPDTIDQCFISAGTPKFTSGGAIVMPTIGDQVTWETNYFVLGHTSFANLAPIIQGSTTGNMSYQYQLDTGSGFGTLKTLNAANVSAEVISPTTGFKLRVIATTTVAATTNQIQFLQVRTVTNSTDQQIQYPLPKLQLATVSGIVAGSRIQVYNVTTASEIANEIVAGTSWSLPYTDGDEFTDGDVVRIRLTNTNGLTAYIGQQLAAAVGATGWSALASQVLDDTYDAYGVDGSTVTKFDADYVNDQIDLNTAANFSGVELYAWFVNNLFTEDGIRNFFGGIRAIDEGNLVIDQTIVDLQLDNLTTTNVFQNDNIRIFRVDGNYPVVNPTTGGGGIDINWRNQVFPISVGGSALTPTESAWLSDINSRTSRVDGLIEDVSGDRFTAKALEEGPAGGGGGSSDWTNTEKEQIRNRLGIDGTASAPSASPTLATPASVRTNLATELARIDVATSSRLATAGYTAPANADIAAIKAKTDTLVNTDLTPVTTAIGALNDLSAAEVNTQVDLALSDYDAPTKAELDAVESTLLTAIGSGGVTPAEVYDYFAFGTRPDIFKADLTGVLTQIATRSSSAELTAQTSTLLTAIGSGGVTAAEIYSYFTALTRADAFKADLTQVLTDIAAKASSVELNNQTNTLLTAIGSGGVTPAEVYDYFVALTRADAFKADVSALATTTQLNDAETAILTAIGDLEFGDVIRNEQISAVVIPTTPIVATVIQNQTLTGIVQE